MVPRPIVIQSRLLIEFLRIEKDKVYSRCCCAPQRTPPRKEHTQYAALPRRPHSRCCPRHCTALRGVGVEGLSTIAIFQVCALLKLVVANPAHIVVVVRFIAMHLFKLTAEVIRIGNLLLVWINHLQPVVLGFYMEKLSKIQGKYPLLSPDEF